MTPLHLAVQSGHIKVVDYLFDQQADVDTQDNDGVINAGRLVQSLSFFHSQASALLLFKNNSLSAFKLQRHW